MNSKIILISLVAFCSTRGIMAQTGLSGSWAFSDQQSISGKLYSNGSPKSVTIVVDNQSFLISKVISGKDSDISVTDTLTVDGKPFSAVTPSGRKKIITARWSADKKTLTEVTSIFDAADPTKLLYVIKDSWSLEFGSLVLDRKAEDHTNGENWESKAIYDRQ
jgi:hypothetical protein